MEPKARVRVDFNSRAGDGHQLFVRPHVLQEIAVGDEVVAVDPAENARVDAVVAETLPDGLLLLTVDWHTVRDDVAVVREDVVPSISTSRVAPSADGVPVSAFALVAR